MEKRERKFFSPEEKARALFQERGATRRELWKSIVEESRLNEKNKRRFKEILDTPFDPIKHGMVRILLLSDIEPKLWHAAVYSYQDSEAFVVYKNIESDIEAFEKELYSE